jgi:3-oxoacyl-[acyl-carrier-protein] synthase-3
VMNIECIEYYLPNTLSSLSDLAQQSEFSWDEARVFEKLMGLKQVPRDIRKTPYDNIRLVLTSFLKKKKISSVKDRYIFISHTADYIVPFQLNLSQLITDEFQFTRAICFSSVVNKCATPFHFFKLAASLFKTLNDDEYILMINSDTAFTKVLKMIPGSTVMGDAASVILLSKTACRNHFIDVEIDADDRFCHGVFADKPEQLLFQSVYADKLSMVINNLVSRNQLSMNQVRTIFPHNVNILSWKLVAKKLNISVDKIYLSNVSMMGHCFGSDPFINLEQAVAKNTIATGDYYVLATVGLGATFSAMLFQY